MRYIKYALLAVIAVSLIVVALANRGMVKLQLLPDELAGLVGTNFSIELPLFLVILAGIAVGLLVGYLLEWIREHRHRREGAIAKREAARMEREVTRLKGPGEAGGDEILTLLESKN